jgi:pimeloyl-ACP methyl ester carboxylesterase
MAAQSAAARDRIIAVNGQNLSIEIFGADSPNVVFEAGLGNDMSTWKAVAGPVASFARVVLYDRAGLGRSVPLANRQAAITADAAAANLHALLAAAELRPPYILVGHSLGGLYVQMFARKYPKEVGGALLLDAASPEAPSELKTRARLAPGTAAYLEEEGIAESNRQILNAGPFPAIPLIVIAATDHGPFFKSWEPTLFKLQRQLAALSPRASLVVAQGSGHDVQLDRPAMVIDAIRHLVAAGGGSSSEKHN